MTVKFTIVQIGIISFLFTAICKASSDNHFAFLLGEWSYGPLWTTSSSHFFFLGMVLITASCTMSGTSIHSTSGTLLEAICHFHYVVVRDLI